LSNRGMIETIGKLFCLYVGLKLAYWAYQMIICYAPWVKPVNFSNYGEWTVITGATDGIGKEYAKQIAALGQNLVIVGRNSEKLATTKTEIEELKVECRTIQADLSKQTEIARAQAEVEKLCSELDCGVLIINAGVSYEHMDFYHDLSSQKLDCLVDVNCSALMMITQAFMKSRVEKKKGLIINISSTFGVIPAPFCSLYGATKAFVRHFSKSILYEYSGHNIQVQCITPGMVQTKMTGLKRSSFMAPTPKRFVQDALCSAGRISETSGYIGHEVQKLTFILFPGDMLGTMLANRLKGVRDRHYAKMKKQ